MDGGPGETAGHDRRERCPDGAGGAGGSAGSGAAGDLPPEARPCMAEHRAGRACAIRRKSRPREKRQDPGGGAEAMTPKKDKTAKKRQDPGGERKERASNPFPLFLSPL